MVDFSHREPDVEVILQVGSHEFRANIDVLSSVSPVFKEMLNLEFPQNEARKIRLDNVMPIHVDIFEIFLASINSSDLSMLTTKNVYGVRALADRFEVPDLLKRCSDFVRDADGIAPWRKRRLGEQWRDTQLVEHATKVIKHRQRLSSERCRRRQRGC
ncbi:hypothetical protein AAVH_03599 [Aphelenchoides avenae]|nr:hypothetical protein AAVH_03599 [Aphelenchus avenae]